MRQAGAVSYDSRCLKLSTYYLIYYLAVPPFSTAVSDILVPPRYQLYLQIGFFVLCFRGFALAPPPPSGVNECMVTLETWSVV